MASRTDARIYLHGSSHHGQEQWHLSTAAPGETADGEIPYSYYRLLVVALSRISYFSERRDRSVGLISKLPPFPSVT